MKTQKTRVNFWPRLAVINFIPVVLSMSCYLQLDSMEDQIMAVPVLVGVGLLLPIIDTISIVVAYSQYNPLGLLLGFCLLQAFQGQSPEYNCDSWVTKNSLCA
jgi:hypothetical protein